MKTTGLWTILLLAQGAWGTSASDAADRYYRAIRNNDVTALRSLIKSGDVNTRDKRDTTPLMFASAIGTSEAMRLLIDAGADVNAKNAFDATALMWCAGDIYKIKLLVSNGAGVNARSKQGRTPLLIAAASNDSYEVVKFLMDSGADVSARDSMGQTALLLATAANDTATIKLLLAKNLEVNAVNMAGLTPLMYAAMNGNAEIVRTLITRGADVNAVSKPTVEQPVKNGMIALGSFTPLILSAVYSGSDVVKALLDAGANVNAQDVRGMTPLMTAVASDHADLTTIRLLLAKGADPAIQSKAGESTIDWARKFANPAVYAALGISRARLDQPVATLVEGRKPLTASLAAARSIALLQRSSGSFFKEGGCGSCHAQNLTGMAVAAARANGIPVNEEAHAAETRGAQLAWSSFEQMLLQRLDPPAGTDITMYTLFQLSTGKATPDRATDAMVHNIASQQWKAGNWHQSGISRPPMEDGDFSRTALSLRALQVFGPAGRKAEFADRIGSAANWLVKAAPRTTEDRDMQILGLTWAGAEQEFVATATDELKRLQRADGGWAQTPELESDAYATGQVLYTLHEAGVPSTDPAYRRGVDYLVRTQRDDGSWYVKSRAPKFQPYFQSGFPHDHDQWISMAGTAWAAAGLSFAAPETAVQQASR